MGRPSLGILAARGCVDSRLSPARLLGRTTSATYLAVPRVQRVRVAAPTLASMTRGVKVLLVALTLAVIGLAVGLGLALQEQLDQEQRLSRLARCVAILERNQGMPLDQPTMGCPIYN